MFLVLQVVIKGEICLVAPLGQLLSLVTPLVVKMAWLPPF